MDEVVLHPKNRKVKNCRDVVSSMRIMIVSTKFKKELPEALRDIQPRNAPLQPSPRDWSKRYGILFEYGRHNLLL